MLNKSGVTVGRTLFSKRPFQFYEDLKFYRSFHNCSCSYSHYNTLGVAKNATARQIKKRFFELSKKYHPDKTRSLDDKEKEESDRKYRSFKEAYDVLSNNALRKSYDSTILASPGEDLYNARPSGQTHLRRRKVYNYGRPYMNPNMNDGPSASSSSSTERDASGHNPLNPGAHRSGSNYDVPHFDFDKHFKQQQGYEEHRQRRAQEKAKEARSEYQEYENFQNKRSSKISFTTVTTLSAVLLVALAYFH